MWEPGGRVRPSRVRAEQLEQLDGAGEPGWDGTGRDARGRLCPCGQPELANVRGDDQCLLITLIGSNYRARPSGGDSPREGERRFAGDAGAAKPREVP